MTKSERSPKPEVRTLSSNELASAFSMEISFGCRNCNGRVLDLLCLSFISVISVAPLHAGDWPQWRGPTRNAYPATDAPDVTTLPKELKPIWRVTIGGGFSSPVVAKDKMVYLDENGQK